jgi:hypothetical protein
MEYPQVKYRIIELDETQHSIVVRYYTDEISEFDLATSYIIDENNNNVLQTRPDGTPVRCQTDYNINIWNFPAPSEEEIKKIIEQSVPYDWFRLKIAVKNPNIDTSLSNVSSIMNVEFTATKPSNVTIQTEMTENEIESLISSILNSSSNSQNTSANTN